VINAVLMDFEAVDARNVSLLRLGHDELGVGKQKEMCKRCAKVGSVQAPLLAGLWVKDFVAPGAENIDSVILRQVRKTDGQNWLALAKDSRTPSKIHGLILFVLFVGWKEGGGVRGRERQEGSPRRREKDSPSVAFLYL